MKNSEFKPVKLRLKIDLVSYPARAEGLVNIHRLCEIIYTVIHSRNGQSRMHVRAVKRFGYPQQEAGGVLEKDSAPLGQESQSRERVTVMRVTRGVDECSEVGCGSPQPKRKSAK